MKKDKEIVMPRVSLQSKDLIAEKKQQLKQLFPEAFEEDKINFEELKKTFGESVGGPQERFGLQWSGKTDCYQTIQERSNATLKPSLEGKKAQKFLDDASENLFIEGDNLEVLKLLQESYFGKVKMIYIDPPYNTGKEFIYPDNHKDNLKTYLEYSGQLDENGKKFSTNTEQEGRYHSNWLSMIYPRLFLARNLLTEDGVIFISIDDNEQANLKKICDQIFGEDNFIAIFPRITKKAGKTTDLIAKNNDYLICYRKSKTISLQGEIVIDEKYSHSDIYEKTRGKYKLSQTLDYSSIQYSSSLDYEIIIDDYIFRAGGVTKEEMEERKKRNPKSDFCWRWSKKLFDFGRKNDFIIIKESSTGKRIYTKTYLNAVIEKTDNGYKIVERERTKVLSTLELIENKFSNDNSKKDLSKIFDRKIFEYSKPISLLKKITFIGTNKNDIVLDFFAGSCTTADAVMQLNAEDGGKRKFIMVQLPEPCNPDSEAFQAGFPNIAEIGKERIRRASSKIRQDLKDKITNLKQKIEKLKEKNAKANEEKSQEITAEIEKHSQEIFTLQERAENLDLAFQSFRLTSSNFEEWQSDPQQLENRQLKNLQQALETQANPIKKDSKDLDILFEILLKEGILLSAKITVETIAGKKVYFVAEHNLYIFLEKVSLEWIEELFKKEPAKIILLDSGFGDNDELKINCFQKIKILEQQKEQSVILKTI